MPSTIVQTVSGETKVFTSAVSRFIVAHPKASAIIALLVGAVIGHLL